MVTFIEYSSGKIYNSLPDIAAAHDEFESNNIQKIVDSIIGPMFVGYGVQSDLGLALLHKHFSLHEEEKLVNYGAVACPWDMSTMSAQVTQDIHPSSWRFIEPTALGPYEFEYVTGLSPPSKLEGPQFQAFLAELGAFLHKHNLIHLLGLQLLETPATDREPGLEFTADRVNVTLPQKVSGPDGKNAVEALWVFDERLIELEDKTTTTTVHRHCIVTCVKVNRKGHRRRHLHDDDDSSLWSKGQSISKGFRHVFSNAKRGSNQ